MLRRRPALMPRPAALELCGFSAHLALALWALGVAEVPDARWVE
jgi:hypothetical protein